MSKMFCFDILRKLLICNKMLLLYRYKEGYLLKFGVLMGRGSPVKPCVYPKIIDSL